MRNYIFHKIGSKALMILAAMAVFANSAFAEHFNPTVVVVQKKIDWPALLQSIKQLAVAL